MLQRIDNGLERVREKLPTRRRHLKMSVKRSNADKSHRDLHDKPLENVLATDKNDKRADKRKLVSISEHGSM